jgi:hypothetical protein
MKSSHILVLVFAVLFYGCGQKSASPAGGEDTGNGDSVIIMGNLTAAAAPLNAPGKFSQSFALPGYKIISQALSNKRIYIITTDLAGDFDFTVPKNDSYTFHILNEDYHYVAPLVMSEYDPQASWVPEGLMVNTVSVDLGQVILSESEFVAVLAEDSAITIDQDIIAAAVAGIPVGASIQGQHQGYYDGCPLDPDGDGVLSIMDSDDDGDGLLDEFDPDWVNEFSSGVVDHLGLFTNFFNNLNASGGIPASRSDDQYQITVESVVLAGEENKITAIAVEGPPYLDNFHILPGALSTNWVLYNDKNLVKDYLIPVTDERWGAFIESIPSAHIWNEVSPGDVWVFEVTFNDGGTEYTELMAKKINFVFGQTPQSITVDNNTWTSQVMYNLPDTAVIKWSIITALPGMTYSVTGWPIINGQQHGNMFTHEAGIDVDSLVFVLEDTLSTGQSIEAYDIDVAASNPNGDNAKTNGGWISKNAAF